MLDCIYGFFLAADSPELLELFADDLEDCYTPFHTEEETEPGSSPDLKADKKNPNLITIKE